MVDRKRIENLHKKYAKSERHFQRIFVHCQVVEEIAISAARKSGADVDYDLLSTAALLHDIGSYMLMDEDGNIDHTYYQLHAIFSAVIAEEEGFSGQVSETIKTHQNLGTTYQEFLELGWAAPEKDYEPKSEEAKILSFADRFHSKEPVFRESSQVREHLQSRFPAQVERFDAWLKKYGEPDIDNLSKKYGHRVA